MASWMVHLRVADALLSDAGDLEEAAFVVGNIAPDSGVPSPDWTYYTPDGKTSHFKREAENGELVIDLARFQEEYLTPERVRSYDRRQYSFYLGYWVHLFTDILWAERIAKPCKDKYREGKGLTREMTPEEKQEMVWAIKADWYDLDFLYLQKHPDFRAFHIYEGAKGFQNDFLDIFARDAFENRRVYITGFYREGRQNLDREYPYLTEEEANRFVAEAAETVGRAMREL